MRLAVDEAPLMPHYSRDSLRCGAFHRLVNCITEIVGGVGGFTETTKDNIIGYFYVSSAKEGVFRQLSLKVYQNCPW